MSLFIISDERRNNDGRFQSAMFSGCRHLQVSLHNLSSAKDADIKLMCPKNFLLAELRWEPVSPVFVAFFVLFFLLFASLLSSSHTGWGTPAFLRQPTRTSRTDIWTRGKMKFRDTCRGMWIIHWRNNKLAQKKSCHRLQEVKQLWISSLANCWPKNAGDKLGLELQKPVLDCVLECKWSECSNLMLY